MKFTRIAACIALLAGIASADQGEVQSAVRQQLAKALGGQADGTGATSGQVLTKQSDGSIKFATVSGTNQSLSSVLTNGTTGSTFISYTNSATTNAGVSNWTAQGAEPLNEKFYFGNTALSFPDDLTRRDTVFTFGYNYNGSGHLVTAGDCATQLITPIEREAMDGFQARASLIEAHAAAVTSQSVATLVGEAASLGAASERFNSAIRDRTGFIAPIVSGTQWVEGHKK